MTDVDKKNIVLIGENEFDNGFSRDSNKSGAAVRFRPRVISRWSDQDVFELIACIEDNPPLWSQKCPEYRYRGQRGKIWKEISTKVFGGKYDDFELMGKWASLRSSYRTCVRTEMSGKPITWQFYTPMKFLAPTDCDATESNDYNMLNEDSNSNASKSDERPLKRRKSTNSERSDSPNRFDDNGSPQHDKESQQHEHTLEPQQRQVTGDERGTRHEPTKEPRQRQEHAVEHRNYGTRSYEVRPTQQSFIVESIKTAVDCIRNTAGKEEEFEIFGKYVASELRAIKDVETARRIKNKLSRFLLDALDAIEDEPVGRFARS